MGARGARVHASAAVRRWARAGSGRSGLRGDDAAGAHPSPARGSGSRREEIPGGESARDAFASPRRARSSRARTSPRWRSRDASADFASATARDAVSTAASATRSSSSNRAIRAGGGSRTGSEASGAIARVPIRRARERRVAPGGLGSTTEVVCLRPRARAEDFSVCVGRRTRGPRSRSSNPTATVGDLSKSHFRADDGGAAAEHGRVARAEHAGDGALASVPARARGHRCALARSLAPIPRRSDLATAD